MTTNTAALMHAAHVWPDHLLGRDWAPAHGKDLLSTGYLARWGGYLVPNPAGLLKRMSVICGYLWLHYVMILKLYIL